MCSSHASEIGSQLKIFISHNLCKDGFALPFKHRIAMRVL
ncbi:hypothetical protein EG68_11350 [Paragonimus skrjabini miyazakii]|uniref:Uncharacterized protein n=1 Tax=Paragonimus skrjabini miyazakii TaxID=59628 RepID=A0A8S9YEE6_9TREM|nr:hypothetical protein EG68_11350 [Paragonimus skrjabini miyazakii]